MDLYDSVYIMSDDNRWKVPSTSIGMGSQSGEAARRRIAGSACVAIPVQGTFQRLRTAYTR